MNTGRRVLAGGLLAGLSTGACTDPPTGLAAAPDGAGPTVVFDLDHRPLPEIPLPNDIATRPDRSSPTGLRLNASMIAPTQFERTARRRIDQLSGWGGYQPIFVSFDRPLDLDVILERHRDYETHADGRDYDFGDDAVYVIDVTPDSPGYLEPVVLDFGEGNFPVLLRTPSQYFEHDPKTITKTLTLETHDEDVNANGELDPGEDIDLDGVLDRPNAYDRDDDGELDPVRELVSFYEHETNTLMFRPILPLRERTTYAVVLTTRLQGRDGNPVVSPFEFVNHAAQTAALEPVRDALAELDLDDGDVAFAWTFTTQDATGDMVMVRDGMYGAGPLAWLAQDNPAELSFLYPMRDEVDAAGEPVANRHVLPSEVLRPIIDPLAQAAFSDLGVNNTRLLVRTHDYYGHHVSGRFLSPRLLDLDPEGNLDERAWPADLRDPSVRERVVYDEVQFWCAIPKKTYLADERRPAPVVLYAHGYTSNKIEQLGLGLHAKFGIAGCSIDAVGHGVDVGDREDLVADLFEIIRSQGAGDAMVEGRAEDVDLDGGADPGAEFFTAYMFRTRDNLRQTLVDYLGLVRLLRQFGTRKMDDMDGDGRRELLGDFDADGVVDLGGPDTPMFASGTSLGGLVSSMLSAIEPSVVAAAPISGGAGLVDLAIRSEQGGMVEAVSLRLMGPLIVGEPDGEGGTRIYSLFPSGNDDARRTLAYRDDIRPDDVVMVTNLDAMPPQSRCARVMPDDPPGGYEDYRGWPGLNNCPTGDQAGLACRTCADGTEGTYPCDLARTFRVGVPADKGDRLVIEVFRGHDSVTIEGSDRQCRANPDARHRTTIDEFEVPVEYWRRNDEGKRVPWSLALGDELVALEDGFGFQRGTPSFRKFTSFGQIIVEGADPAMYAPHYSRDPLMFREDDRQLTKDPTNVLTVVTVGDPNVPVNTGIGIAKVAGFVELFEPDPRHGKTINRVLIDEGIQEGIPWLEIRGSAWGPVLVDPDNISGSTNVDPGVEEGSIDGLLAPRLEPPLRLVGPTPGTADGRTALVLPMIDAEDGAHGFSPPGMTALDFDVGQFMEHQIGVYFESLGTLVRYDPCMETMDGCGFIASPPPEP